MTQAAGGIWMPAPTASIRPLRMRTVPRGITGALTGTTRAFRIATTEGTSAWSAQAATIASRNRFIVLIAYYKVSPGGTGFSLWTKRIMASRKRIGYRQAGVDIDEADRAVAHIRKLSPTA